MLHSFQIPPFTIPQYPLRLWNVYPAHRLIKTEKVIYKDITFISKNRQSKNSIKYRLVQNLESEKAKAIFLPWQEFPFPRVKYRSQFFKICIFKSPSYLCKHACQLWKHRIDIILDGPLFKIQNIFELAPHKYNEDLTYIGFMVWWCVVMFCKLVPFDPFE